MEDDSSKLAAGMAGQSPLLGTTLLDAARRDAQQLAIRECWELIQILGQSGVITVDAHQLQMIQEALQRRLDALVNPEPDASGVHGAGEGSGTANPDDRLPTG